MTLSRAATWTVWRRKLPMRNIVDSSRVWESHADSNNRRVGRPVPERALPIYTVNDADGGGVGRVATAVTTSPTVPDQLEKLLRRLLPTPVLPIPPPKPVPSDLELFLQQPLGGGAQNPRPTLPDRTGITDVKTLLQNLLPVSPAPVPRLSRLLYAGTGRRYCVSRVANRVMARRGARH